MIMKKISRFLRESIEIVGWPLRSLENHWDIWITLNFENFGKFTKTRMIEFSELVDELIAIP